MNVQLPNNAAGFYPAPTNHIVGDPTPLDQAVYIPSVTPGYAIAAHEQNWSAPLPAGIGAGDLNFLDPANPLFRISHVMSSAGQALLQKQPCIIQTRDRSATMMIGDSGGYQIASGRLKINGDPDRLRILHWLEQHADWAMTLDVPTGPLDSPGYKYGTFKACLDETLYNLGFFQKHRTPGATKFLNVLQGNTTQQTDAWFDAVKGYQFEGWAFAGKLRHNFYNLCRRIIIMANENLIQDRDWIHVLGTNELETAVGLTALQRAINRHINPRLRISFDTSAPFRMSRWRSVYSVPRFDLDKMTLKSVKCPDARQLRGSPVRFPWPSPLGDRLTLGDLCVRPGANLNSYLTQQSHFYINHHNLASLCYAVALANRVFDSESLLGEHTISDDMGRAVAAIDHVIKTGSLQALERKRSVFKAIRKIEELGESEEDRDFLES